MTHRTRNEQRDWKARKDPHKLARPTRIHKVKTSEIFRRQDEEMEAEIDAAFAEYMEEDR